MDIFEEFMFVKKKESKDYLKIGGIMAAAAAVSCILFVLPVIIAQATGLVFSFTIPLILAAVAWYGAYMLIQRNYTELEYTLVNSEMDIDKIIGKKSRKKVISVDFRDAEIVAAVDDEAHKAEYLRDGFKVYDASGNYTDNIYFADFSKDGGKIRLLFRPTDKIIKEIRVYNPRNVFIKE